MVCFLALFICSGPLKHILEYVFPSYFDLTFLLLIVLFLLGINKSFHSKINNIFSNKILSLNILIIAFFIFLMISSLYTKSENAFLEKLLRIYILAIPSFFIPALFFKTDHIRKFTRAIIYVIGSLSLIHLFMIILYGNKIYRSSFELHTSYLLPGTFFGAGLIILIIDRYETKFFHKIEIYILFSLLFVSLVMTSARAAILFSLLIILFYVLLKNRKSIYKNIISISGLILSIFILLVIFSPNIFKRPLDRFDYFLKHPLETRKEEGISRKEHITKAFEGISQAPLFGNGIGSYGMVSFEEDSINIHPHNILLEIWFEGGIISLFLFLSFLFLLFFKSFIYLNQKKTENKKFVILFLFINFYFLLNYLKSFDLAGFRIWSVFLGIQVFLLLKTSK